MLGWGSVCAVLGWGREARGRGRHGGSAGGGGAGGHLGEGCRARVGWWRRRPCRGRAVASESCTVSGRRRQTRVAVAGESHTRKEERCLSPCKQRYCAQHSSGTDHRISLNHLLKRGALRNRQKLGNLVLYMTLGSKLALCFKFDCICGSKDSKFDTAAASLSKWTAKSIERGVRAA